MTTPRKGWPAEHIRERERMVDAATRLHNMMLVTYEYGVLTPERNIPFIRSMLPNIIAIAEDIRRIASSMLPGTRSWPKTLFWCLSVTIQEMDKFIIAANLTKRRMEQHDYISTFRFFEDDDRRNTTMRVLDAIWEVPCD